MAGFLERLAPGIVARREAARLEIAQVRLQASVASKQAELVQGYDAAKRSGRTVGWTRPLTSASSEMQGALPFLRASARDLVRNSPHANRAMRVIQSHVAGTGVRPRAAIATDDPDTREAVMRITGDQWARFVENCDPSGKMDFYGQQRLLMRTVAEAGEALRVWVPVEIDGRLRWRCRILEPDHLDHLKNESLKDGGRIVQGVEFDSLGTVVAYHMHESHPGDRYSRTGLRHHVRRVPAEMVDHVFEVLRPGQVRGVSWFAPVAMVLRDIDDLAEAEVVRKKLEACISMVVHNANDEPDAGAAVGQLVTSDGAALTNGAGQAVESLSPGTVLNARPGWSVDFHAPPASEGLVDHMTERLHAVAAGIGVTYFQLTGDLSKANYSSMRAGELEFGRLVDSWQADLMIHQSGRPAWRRVMQAAQINGELTTPILPRAEFTPPKRPWVDPEKDIKASILEIEAGLAAPQTHILRAGRTPEEVMEDRVEWEAMQARLAGDNTGDENAEG